MSGARNRVRRGAALIEVLVASIVLATVSTAALSWLSESIQSTRIIRQTERDVIETSEALDRLMLLPSDSLDALQGWTPRGRWSLHVTRVGDSLFDVSLARSPGGVAILSTTVYHPRDAGNR